MTGITGTGALTASPPTLSGSAKRGVHSSSASLSASIATLAGTAHRGSHGSGALTGYSGVVSSISGTRRIHGTGDMSPLKPTLDAVTNIPDTTIWDNAVGKWGDATLAYSEAKPVMILGNLFFQAENGVKFDDQPVVVVLSRTGLTIIGRDRMGQWKIDPTTIKEVIGLYPVMRGVSGTVVHISVGAQDTPDESVRWEGPYEFIIGESFYQDFTISGRFIAVKFESEGQEPWELLSYDLDVNIIGGR